MKLEKFIEENRLRGKRDECGDLEAVGKRGTIYEYGEGMMGVTVIGAETGHLWRRVHRELKEAGCRITQNGDCEGSAVFEPGKPEQVEVVLEAIQAKRKKKMSLEMLAQLAEMRSRKGSQGART